MTLDEAINIITDCQYLEYYKPIILDTSSNRTYDLRTVKYFKVKKENTYSLYLFDIFGECKLITLSSDNDKIKLILKSITIMWQDVINSEAIKPVPFRPYIIQTD